METLKGIVDVCVSSAFFILFGFLLVFCWIGLGHWVVKSLLAVWRRGRSVRKLVFFSILAIATLLAQKPEDEEDDGESGNYSLSEDTTQIYALWTLRNAAKAMLGNTSYADDVDLPRGNGFSGVGKIWKCNQFVARMIRTAGFTVPVMHGRFFSYPPVANDWANGVPIEGWQWLGRDLFIQPGFVIGHPADTGPGHCGIVDFDGCGIGAGEAKVNREKWSWHDGTSGFNKYIKVYEGD